MTNQCGDEAVGTTAEAPNGNTYKIKIMIKPDGTEIRKFPNGYDVRVVRKQDILDCIDENIIDKEIALELITQCEIDACQYINEGKWTGLPYIGSVRLNDGGKILRENKELLNEAKEKLDDDKYILFKKSLVIEGKTKIKKSRYFNYIVSQAVTKNRKLYLKLCDTKGEHYAKIFLFASKHVVAINNEYVNLEDDEQ